MNTASTVAVIAGILSIISVVVSVFGTSLGLHITYRNTIKLDQRRSDEALARLRYPLMAAAFDLQSRIHNILERDFFQTFYHTKDNRHKAYAVDNTSYIIARYFCLSQLVERERAGLSDSASAKAAKIDLIQNNIKRHFSSDVPRDLLMTFAGEQSAIGEDMIENSDKGSRCISYSSFLNVINIRRECLINFLRDDVIKVAYNPDHARTRLLAVHSELLNLLDAMDPQGNRYDKSLRRKIAA